MAQDFARKEYIQRFMTEFEMLLETDRRGHSR